MNKIIKYALYLWIITAMISFIIYLCSKSYYMAVVDAVGLFSAYCFVKNKIRYSAIALFIALMMFFGFSFYYKGYLVAGITLIASLILVKEYRKDFKQK